MGQSRKDVCASQATSDKPVAALSISARNVVNDEDACIETVRSLARQAGFRRKPKQAVSLQRRHRPMPRRDKGRRLPPPFRDQQARAQSDCGTNASLRQSTCRCVRLARIEHGANERAHTLRVGE